MMFAICMTFVSAVAIIGWYFDAKRMAAEIHEERQLCKRQRADTGDMARQIRDLHEFLVDVRSTVAEIGNRIDEILTTLDKGLPDDRR